MTEYFAFFVSSENIFLESVSFAIIIKFFEVALCDSKYIRSVN